MRRATEYLPHPILWLFSAACLLIGGQAAAESETPDETPNETPDETRDETPDETPNETPNETPDETPDETRDEASSQSSDNDAVTVAETRTKPEWYPTSAQLGVTVGVPFYDESIINGDLTVDIRYGRKIGWMVPYFSGGFRQSRLDPARVPDEARRKKLEAWHMTIGLRLEVPVSRYLFPFAGAAVEKTQWGFEADTTGFCNAEWYPEAWYCYERYQWKAGTALKQQLGLIYKPEPSLALEFWAEHVRIYAPEMFTRPVRVISPGIGFAWHH